MRCDLKHWYLCANSESFLRARCVTQLCIVVPQTHVLLRSCSRRNGFSYQSRNNASEGIKEPNIPFFPCCLICSAASFKFFVKTLDLEFRRPSVWAYWTCTLIWCWPKASFTDAVTFLLLLQVTGWGRHFWDRIDISCDSACSMSARFQSSSWGTFIVDECCEFSWRTRSKTVKNRRKVSTAYQLFWKWDSRHWVN